MDIKSAEKFMEKLVKAGMEYGFEECEASYATESSMSIDILNGEVSSYENSATSSLSFRGLKNGQMGYCSTNILEDSSIDFLLKSAMENCEVLNDEDPQFIYCDENNKDLYFSQVTDAYSKNTYKSFSELGLKIEKAILAANIGITPNVDGNNIRLVVPELTGERRKEFVKMASKVAEETKVALRNIRRDANDAYKKQEKASEITEDDLKKLLDDAQKTTDKFIAKVDEEFKKKEKEILAK